MKSDKEKQDALWKASFLLMADQIEKDHVWKHGVGEQYKEMSGRLIIYHTNQILHLENISYSEEFKKQLMSRIGETLGLGFYLYCADLVDIRHKFENYFEVKIPDDPGLKDYLIKEFGTMEDGGEVRDALEPPKYVLETAKNWFFWTVKNVTPNDSTVNELQSDAQKEFFLTKMTWLIASGYMQAALAERYHKIWLANNQKVGG